MRLLLCETISAICWHLREETDDKPKMLTGSDGNTFTLCGSRVGWDVNNRRPENAACRECRKKAGLRPTIEIKSVTIKGEVV